MVQHYNMLKALSIMFSLESLSKSSFTGFEAMVIFFLITPNVILYRGNYLLTGTCMTIFNHLLITRS